MADTSGEGSFGQERMRAALDSLARRTGLPAELIVVGGAAAILSGWLVRATNDIDVLSAHPRLAIWGAAIEAVADEFGLSAGWLNDAAKAYEDVLPGDYRTRLVDIETFGMLRVRAVSRQDFVLLKLYALRVTDVEDLAALAPPVTSEELAFVRAQLSRIAVFDDHRAHRVELYLDAAEADRTSKE